MGFLSSPTSLHFRSRSAHYAAVIFLSLLASYAYFLPKSGVSDWVANSRADLVYSIANHGTFAIDAYHDNTGDKAFYNCHYYAVGSPGPSVLAPLVEQASVAR